MALKRHNYHVATDDSEGTIHLTAVKNRLSPLGTTFSHLSIIILILGFIIGSVWGFENPAFIVSEGDKRDVGFGTNLSLLLISFADEYWETGAPKDFRSEVVVYRDGLEVKRGIIRVNEPLGYDGVSFYQSFYGPSAELAVKNEDGKEVYRGNLPLAEIVEINGVTRPIGGVTIPGTELHAYIIGPVSALVDPDLKTGQAGIEIYVGNATEPVATDILEQGKPVNLAGLEFTYLSRNQFSGFIVKRDPGTWLIWLASALFLLGIFLVFYFPRREVHAFIKAGTGGSILTLGASSTRLNTSPEIQSILHEIKRSLTSKV
jgi:cytochrome c biogenesis protein